MYAIIYSCSCTGFSRWHKSFGFLFSFLKSVFKWAPATAQKIQAGLRCCWGSGLNWGSAQKGHIDACFRGFQYLSLPPPPPPFWIDQTGPAATRAPLLIDFYEPQLNGKWAESEDFPIGFLSLCVYFVSHFEGVHVCVFWKRKLEINICWQIVDWRSN